MIKFDKKIFLKNIEYLREKYGVKTQNEFNETIGQRGAITRWGKGEFAPSVHTALAISEKYPCSIDWLLTGQKGSKLRLVTDPELEELYKAVDRMARLKNRKIIQKSLSYLKFLTKEESKK